MLLKGKNDMLILTVVIICAVGFSLWLWYEMKHALEIDDYGNAVFTDKTTLFDKEHDESVEFRSTTKC